MQLEKGKLLISKPSLYDSTFNRTVVLLVEHNDEGTVGFILNKPSKYHLTEFVNNINEDFKIYDGGPVERQNIYYIHSRPDLISDSVKISNNIYWSGNFEDVKYQINNGLLDALGIRFFLGYSGWAAGQLQEELERNAWVVQENGRLNIFDDLDGSIWKEEMIRLGGENILWAGAPNDPRFN